VVGARRCTTAGARDDDCGGWRLSPGCSCWRRDRPHRGPAAVGDWHDEMEIAQQAGAGLTRRDPHQIRAENPTSGCCRSACWSYVRAAINDWGNLYMSRRSAWIW
jgi:hypothetical protein